MDLDFGDSFEKERPRYPGLFWKANLSMKQKYENVGLSKNEINLQLFENDILML